MKIILTGASGFLGSAIVSELSKTHQVITLGRSSENDISCDLALQYPDLPIVDMVVHAAGKAHMLPKTEQDAQEFYNVNVKGTQNLLKALNQALPKTFVFISTVAVYGCESGESISESHPLQGSSPYAKSKIEAENLVTEWGAENRVPVVVLRLPLISGTNPPGNLKAMAKAIRGGYYFRIGSGEARKSIVSTVDIAKFIPQLMHKQGIYNLTDGVHPSLVEIEENISIQVNKRIKRLPISLLKIAAKLGDSLTFFPLNTMRLEKLTATLTFDDGLARKQLDWMPTPALLDLKFTNQG